MKEALFYLQETKGLRCTLCPHYCLIKESHSGICGSRVNKGGKLWSMVYGHLCALAIDPIEKKPLLHFHPGSKCLSLACTGCNLHCLNCQNYTISQALPGDVSTKLWSPEDLVNICLEKHIPGIAYTYTEPLTWYEYTYDIARNAHQAGLWNILVSAGYINPVPLRMLLPYIDAANIDLKSFNNDLYKKINGATLQPVLKTLIMLKESDIHLEITNLLIPNINCDELLIKKMCYWLVEHGFADTPLHFTRFFPTYKMEDNIPTPLKYMKRAQQIAQEAGIHYVHLGNI